MNIGSIGVGKLGMPCAEAVVLPLGQRQQARRLRLHK